MAGQGQRKKLDNVDGPFSAELAYTKGRLKRVHTGSGGGRVSLRSSSLCVGPSSGKREGFGPQPKAFGIRIWKKGQALGLSVRLSESESK